MATTGTAIQDSYIQNTLGAPQDRERRIERLFGVLDNTNSGTIDADTLLEAFREQYHPLPNTEECVEHIISVMAPHNPEVVRFDDFKSYMSQAEGFLASSFKVLDSKQDGKLDFDEVYNGLEALGLEDIDLERAEQFFNLLDIDGDGYISYDEWAQFLLFVPMDNDVPLRAAYSFFAEEMDFSSEGDLFLGSDLLHGLGYFLAGGFAGVVSRTCTAPFDRLKVYLIAQSGSPVKAAAPSTGTSTARGAASVATTTAAESSAANTAKSRSGPLIRAVKHIWSQGGVRSFFVGNGLNVVKVFPESAMKFGSFEATKRFFAEIEGVCDTSEISRTSTFIAGGIGGMVAQCVVYPIDTLKFRIQCESISSSLSGNALLKKTVQGMWQDGGLRMFYRGLGVGVLGIFPFAALDLGTFEAMKRAYLAREAKKQGIPESEVKLGNLVVLSMGASSGCVGASAVYPVNLLRTRLQAQGTHAHPYRYTGFMDVYHKTVARDGYKGLWRGLAPNLAKVAPAVSISYLVYENSKAVLGLN